MFLSHQPPFGNSFGKSNKQNKDSREGVKVRFLTIQCRYYNSILFYWRVSPGNQEKTKQLNSCLIGFFLGSPYLDNFGHGVKFLSIFGRSFLLYEREPPEIKGLKSSRPGT